MKTKKIYILLLLLIATSCGEYTKLQKSTDNDLKFSKAKEYYEKGKYLHAATLLESVVPVFKGTEKGEEALYLLGMSYMKNQDYLTSRNYFSGYYRSYPKGRYAEDAKFNVGYCYFMDSPEVKLDQSSTHKAIDELLLFSDLYPNSDKLPQVLEMLKELQNKLAYKAYLNSKLYFKLGNYMGNNYQACVVSATNAIKEYPASEYREELSFLILKAKFLQAEESVLEKEKERYRDAVDEYYNFINEYPKSRYLKEAQHIFAKSHKKMN